MSAANGVLMQFFQWYTNADGLLWNEVKQKTNEFANRGITTIWLPPCSKGSGGGIDVGYGVYDLFDLGEFEQKSSVRPKYGPKQELLEAIKAIQESGMQYYGDVVFNHKDGGDFSELVLAQQVDLGG